MEIVTQGYNLSISVNNFLLSYDDVGEGNIPVIFLHGFPFDKTMWQTQLNFLKSNQRVIAYDIRGFGKSKDEDSSLSIELFANDLIGFMDAMGIEKAIVCGLSMGGYIALNALEKNPNRFQSLILCDTQCIADTDDIRENRFVMINKITLEVTANFNEAFIKSVFSKETFNTKKELVKNVHNVVFANPQRTITLGLVALAERLETCLKLDEIDIPTLIICGREDEVTPLTQSEFMHEAIPNSILQVIEHAGHISNLEQPDIFNQHLSKFLKNNERSNLG